MVSRDQHLSVGHLAKGSNTIFNVQKPFSTAINTCSFRLSSMNNNSQNIEYSSPGEEDDTSHNDCFQVRFRIGRNYSLCRAIYCREGMRPWILESFARSFGITDSEHLTLYVGTEGNLHRMGGTFEIMPDSKATQLNLHSHPCHFGIWAPSQPDEAEVPVQKESRASLGEDQLEGGATTRGLFSASFFCFFRKG